MVCLLRSRPQNEQARKFMPEARGPGVVLRFQHKIFAYCTCREHDLCVCVCVCVHRYDFWV
jgi:hypothetical protein